MLLLLDIDGTLLVRGADAHRKALWGAVEEVHHVALGAIDVGTAGMTDQAIVRQLCLRADVRAEAVDDGMPAVMDAACRRYAQLVEADLSDRVVPGAAAALEALADAGHTLSLVTGNLEPIARMKLRAAGIGDHFASGHGGFGSDAEDRSDLPAIARRRAGVVAGRPGPWPREDAVVVGDTPLDAACAHADGLRCIAVETGPFRARDLEMADVVVASVAALPAALD